MKMFGPAPFANPIKPLAQFLIGWRTGKERLAQRAQVETCAADQYRHSAAVFHVFNRLRGLARPLAGSVVDLRRHEIDQVMGDALAFLERNLGSSDLNALVNLN